MISAMIVYNDPQLVAVVEEYVAQHDSFRLVERTDKESVAIEAILELLPNVVICQDLEKFSSQSLLEATSIYAPNTFFLVCGVQAAYEPLLKLLRSGVGDVLSENWSREELRDALDRFQTRFNGKNRESQQYRAQQLRRIQDKKFFEDTVVTCSGDAILRDLNAIDYEYGISFVDGWFLPLYILIDPKPKENYQPDGFLPMLQLEELTRQFFGSCCDAVVCYVMDNGLSVVINTVDVIEDPRKLCRLFLSQCAQKLTWFGGQNSISIGIGLTSRDPGQIPQMVETAKYAGWMRLSEGKGRVLEYAHYETEYRAKHDFLSDAAAQALQRSVAYMDEAFLVDTISETLEKTENAGRFISAAISINDVLIEAFNQQAELVKNSKYLRLAENMPPMAESMETLEQIQREMIRWARSCMKQLQEKRKYRGNAAILEAKRYISAHYTQPIKLKDVAAQVHLTPSYFCMIFRQETGQTFVEYLTELRLNRAKELLRHSNKKIHEVAVTVGFADSRHFSRTFYRSFGIHPTEYRNQEFKG